MLNALTTPLPIAAGLKIAPSWDLLPDSIKRLFESFIGTAIFICMAVAVFALIGSAGAWAWGKFGNGSQNFQNNGAKGVVASIVVLVILGALAGIVTWALSIGKSLF